MAKGTSHLDLGRRERQIMDVIYRLGAASVAEVRAELPDPPSYSAVRTMLRLLEEKGFLHHHREGTRYVYRPTQSRKSARESALKHLVHTFFDGSAERAVASLLDMSTAALSDDQREHLKQLIDQAKKEGR